jgi:glycosyltransferase involved in cell wall biosynthesis
VAPFKDDLDGLLWSSDPDGDPPRRVAIIHDWLVTYAGSERVLKELLALYPEAEVFTLVDALPVGDRGFLEGHTIHTSFIQRLPRSARWYRHYLPLMPLAVEQFDLRGFDLVISSSHAVAKGVLTGPDQLHVCYCHSPIRYAWDLQHEYLEQVGVGGSLKGWLVRWLLHRIRLWDVRTANGVDGFVANSRFIARRIAKVYGRTAQVVHPPVETAAFTPPAEQGPAPRNGDRTVPWPAPVGPGASVGSQDDAVDASGGGADPSTVRTAEGEFYLTVSRLVPYKRVALIAEAFSHMPDRKLVIIGDGPERDRVLAAAGPNVTVLGHEPTEVVREHMRKAKAFIFAAEEDFGITPVEAQACGTPVIAFGKGGALETVLDGRTGVHFAAQTPGSIVHAVNRFEALAGDLDPWTIRAHAKRFGPERFRRELREAVSKAAADAGWREVPTPSAEGYPDVDPTTRLGGGLHEDEVVVGRQHAVGEERPEDTADDVPIAVGATQNVAPFPVVADFLRNPYQRRSS